MKFSDVIGQEYIKEMLRRGVDSGRVSHAQMFSGACGAGSLALALAYAQYLNCTSRNGLDSCGVCPSCIKYDQLAHPDLHFVMPTNSTKSGSQKPLSDNLMPQWREIAAETGGYFDQQMWYEKIGLDNQQGLIAKREADEVIRKLSFKAFEAEYKVVVIWLPEKMGAEAANGLLKILEEPWEKTVFLLVSAAPTMLLPTILSRVQDIPVPPIDAAVLEGLLSARGMERHKAASVARLAGGDAIEMEKVVSRSESGADDDYFEYFTQLMRFSYNDRHLELLDWADNMASLGRENQKRFFSYTTDMLRESYMLTAGMENISYLWGGERDFCKKFAPYVNNGNIERLVEENKSALSHVSQNGNAKIIFTHYALSVSKLIGRQ